MDFPGSGKTLLVESQKAILDPNIAPVRSSPRDEVDLIIAARGSRCPCFGNLSRINFDQSDALCRLSDGAGLGKRTLYSDFDESIAWVQRPFILNGINPVAHSGDLLDRLFRITLEAIPEDRRKTRMNTGRPGMRHSRESSAPFTTPWPECWKSFQESNAPQRSREWPTLPSSGSRSSMPPAGRRAHSWKPTGRTSRPAMKARLKARQFSKSWKKGSTRAGKARQRISSRCWRSTMARATSRGSTTTDAT